MFRKILFLTMCAMLALTVCGFAADSYGGYVVPVDAEVNGSIIKCPEKPVLINAVAYIPLRAFSDAVGGEIGWNSEDGAATMNKDGHTFVFYPGKGYCISDGERKEYSAIIYKNLTFVPVRAISELLGFEVIWDDFYLTVRINAPGVTVPESSEDKAYSYEDIMWLSKIIQIESGYQHFEVKLGVAGTVMNRVSSSQFPGNIKDVIFDKKYGVQFPPVHTEKINVTPSKESVIAAKCVLNGIKTVGNSLYFIDTEYAASSWAHNNRPHYTDIHGMSFYE